MRKNFYVGYNVYPDLFIDEDWYVPIEKECSISEWYSMRKLQEGRSSRDEGSIVARRPVSTLLAQELVEVRPMNGPIGILNYLDFVYSASNTCSEDEPWYIWKIRRDLDHKAHADGRTIKKFYHVFAEPMTFFTNVRVGDEVRRVEQTTS